MIKIIEGNLLDATEDIIGHQVNCKGMMGSGLALQIKNRYPHVFAGYGLRCLEGKYATGLLGECQIISCDMKSVANLFGQHGFGRDKQHTNLLALEVALYKLRDYSKSKKLTVALPFKMGSDRGGADWNEVYKMIDEVFEDYEVTLYKFN
ncbi:macro domain-containing protein [Paenibacillus donghaensis]|uniref:Macro domain-containing protein n=1 Tax=Paenibacillus donghaensis TaxID=414771 RepID=A0A2Z2KQP4_9BACL|nr:macro domain-containing protein [Paenibacillus donghaensis]ASA22661.1 hypothetical protein B9T62_18815 [Paenibacillus donghaensis]